MSWSQRISIGEGVCKALNYLHTLKGKPLVHGDVKSANVLLDAQYECKLGDFGLARQIMGSSASGMYTHITVTSVHGTSVYLPPEYLRSKVLSSAVDVYSYGIVMIEMATGRRAFNGKRLLIDMVRDELVADNQEYGQVLKLRDPKLPPSPQGDKWFQSLIKLGLECAQSKKAKRPSMAQILEYYQRCKRDICSPSGDGYRITSGMESNDTGAESNPTVTTNITNISDTTANRGAEEYPKRQMMADPMAGLNIPTINPRVQLWCNDGPQTVAGRPVSTVCPTVGSSQNPADCSKSPKTFDWSAFQGIQGIATFY